MNEIIKKVESINENQLHMKIVAMRVKALIRAKREGNKTLMDKAYNGAVEVCTNNLQLSMNDTIKTINHMIWINN
jgi:UDP-N-acetylmuramyl pentapeptide synthase